MDEHFVDLGTGGKIRYLRGGNARGAPLVVLHGIHLAAEYVARSIAGHLADRYALFALDLRGHGKSFRADEPYTLAAYARDVIAFQEKFIGRPCHLAGLSLGGNVALRACVMAPAIADALVMVDVAPFLEKKGLERIVLAQRALPESFPTFDALREFFYVAYKAVPRTYVDELLLHMWKNDGRGHYVRAYDRRVWEVPPDFAETELSDLARSASDLSLPILVVRGAESDVLSRDGAERFVGSLKNGRLAEIGGAGHGVMHERPAECAALMANFFR
jgi:pimeloyl-ACP methyl ester carboxylesterase